MRKFVNAEMRKWEECLPAGLFCAEFFRAEATRLQKTSTGDGNYGKSMLRLKASQDTVGVMCLAEPSEGRAENKTVK